MGETWARIEAKERACGPESEHAMIGATPEDFDKLADQGMAAANENYGGND